MSKNNIATIKQARGNEDSITLDTVKTMLDSWRATKKTQSEKIPAKIWDQIFILLKTNPELQIRSKLSITSSQINREKKARLTDTVTGKETAMPLAQPIDFCEAKQESAIPLAYKPAKAFTTTTSVVELYRPDGMLMKIHLCTDRFEELLRAFFKG
jgi:hypothetical protein